MDGGEPGADGWQRGVGNAASVLPSVFVLQLEVAFLYFFGMHSKIHKMVSHIFCSHFSSSKEELSDYLLVSFSMYNEVCCYFVFVGHILFSAVLCVIRRRR